MKRFYSIVMALLLCLTTFAQSETPDTPWKCKLNSTEGGVKFIIDLYEESVNVPGMDMFGPMNGYLGGNIYGVWMVTSFKINSDKEATIRISNDLGSETQECILTQENDTTYNLKLKGGVCVKKVVNKKLVKIPNSFTMIKSK